MTTIAADKNSIACDLSYESETGLIRNKNKVTGTLRADGYLTIRHKRKNWLAHRLAWYLYTGTLPECVDHVNGIRTDNRLSNLRASNKRLNGENRKGPTIKNKSGFLGVTKHGPGWHAAIRINGKQTHLGTYNTPEEAYHIYLEYKRQNHKHNTL